MSETFRCDDKETLVTYLYGDLDADARREVDRHLRTCAACTREVAGLQSVRQDLALWLPPDADLGFTVVQKPAAVLRPSRWASLGAMPAWAQVAAAALFIAAGAAIANVQVRSTADGFVVTTGWMQAPVPAATVPPVTATNEEWRRELAALEQNLRRELASRATPSEPTPVSTRPTEPVDTVAVLRRVEALVAASEQR